MALHVGAPSLVPPLPSSTNKTHPPSFGCLLLQQLHEVQYDEGTTENVDLTSTSAVESGADETGEAAGAMEQSSTTEAADGELAADKEVRTTTANMLLRGEQKVVWRMAEVEAAHAALSDSGSDDDSASGEDADVGFADADNVDTARSSSAGEGARGGGRRIKRNRRSDLTDSDSESEEEEEAMGPTNSTDAADAAVGLTAAEDATAEVRAVCIAHDSPPPGSDFH